VAWERSSDEASAFVAVGRDSVMFGATSADHDRLDPAEALLREVGAQLRQVRLERGEELDEVARHLRIKETYLFGIEQGDLSALPGRTYALGFLRTYADYLGFDGADLVARIKSSVGDRTRLRIRAPMPENRLPRTPLVVISLGLVAGIYLGWAYLNRSSREVTDIVAEVPDGLRDRPAVVVPPDPPVREAPTTLAEARGSAGAGADARTADAPTAPPAGARVSSPVESSPDSGSPGAEVAARSSGPAVVATDAPPDAAPPGMSGPAAMRADADPAARDRLARSERDALQLQPAAGGETSAPATVSRPGEQNLAAQRAPEPPPGRTVDQPQAGGAARRPDAAAADPARRAVAQLLDAAARGAEGAPQVYEQANSDARVILRAREPSWMQISSPAGDYTFTRTLEPGEALLVPNRSDLELWTGNAGGLEIIVDGTPVPALAGGGAVRRNVSLDPDRLVAASEQAP
jgi:cytoskeleton protein RodZ